MNINLNRITWTYYTYKSKRGQAREHYRVIYTRIVLPLKKSWNWRIHKKYLFVHLTLREGKHTWWAYHYSGFLPESTLPLKSRKVETKQRGCSAELRDKDQNWNWNLWWKVLRRICAYVLGEEIGGKSLWGFTAGPWMNGRCYTDRARLWNT